MQVDLFLMWVALLGAVSLSLYRLPINSTPFRDPAATGRIGEISRRRASRPRPGRMQRMTRGRRRYFKNR
jgi:hypothetical protein